MKYTKLLLLLSFIVCCNFFPFTSFAQGFDALNDQADKEYDASNYQKAIDLATRSIDIKVNARAFYIRANSRFSLKDFEGALRDYNTTITDYRNYYTTDKYKGNMYYWRARCSQKLEKWSDAISDFNSSFTYNYGEPGYAYWNRGNCYYSLKKYTESDDDYAKAIEKLSDAKDLAKLYKYRGDCQGKLLKYDEAIQLYTRSISYNEQYYDAYWMRGFYNSKNKKRDDEIADYKKAISIIETSGNKADYNDLALIYENLALEQFNLDENDEALKTINKAINANPDRVSFYETRADICRDVIGSYEERIRYMRVCIDKNPEYGAAYINIISPLIRLQRFDEALAIYSRYKEKNISSFLETKKEKYGFYNNVISTVTELIPNSMWDEALSRLQNAINEYGSDVKPETKNAYLDILYLKGYIFEKLKRYDEAITIYEQALTIAKNQPEMKEGIDRVKRNQTMAANTDTSPPVIELISPEASRSFDIESDDSKTQLIGRAKDASGIASIKVNGFKLDKIEEDGLFISNFTLSPGKNTIIIEATDKKGNSSVKTFVITGNLTTKGNEMDIPVFNGNPPKYYAILIGENDYADKSIPDLRNPVKDAMELKAIIESKYTFEPKNIDTLFNRSREDILQTIMKRCSSLTENDNLVIFYAGHGIADKDNFGDIDGYWIPVSAKKGVTSTYISTDDINKALKRSSAKHILLIADACFSGAFTRDIGKDASKSIKKQYNIRSRKVMASGNLEPVPDNSRFLYYLKKTLQENTEKYISAKKLFDSFYDAILSNSDNLPQYAAIKNVGDEGGEFVFIKK